MEIKRKTILIVEDEADILDNLSEILSLSGFDILLATNGKEGIEKASEYLPDLIISDITMPIVDGWGLLHVLRNNPKTQSLPIIFLTAKTERADMRNAMQSGADDYLTKPVSGVELLKAVEQRLKRAEMMKAPIGNGPEGVLDLLSVVHDSTEDMELLASGHEAMSYPKKQVVYKEGSMPRFLYFVKSGKVRTYKTHGDGKQLVMNLFNTGDFLGQVALLEEESYKETAETIEDCELVRIPRKDFEKLVHNNVVVANKLIKLLANNITDMENKLLGIAYNTLRKKVAGAIVLMFKKFQSVNGAVFQIDLSREELASIAGTATESLIRTLSEFKAEMLIDIRKDNKIEIRDLKKLEHLMR